MVNVALAIGCSFPLGSSPMPPQESKARANWHAYCGDSSATPRSYPALMMYDSYQVQTDASGPLRVLSGGTAALLDIRWPCLGDTLPARNLVAGCAILARAAFNHRRPSFGIESV